jgi:hypothetical protein
VDGAESTETLLQLSPDTQHIPIGPIADANSTVRETMQFFQLELAAVPMTGHDTAARGAKIHANKASRGPHGLP